MDPEAMQNAPYNGSPSQSYRHIPTSYEEIVLPRVPQGAHNWEATQRASTRKPRKTQSEAEKKYAHKEKEAQRRAKIDEKERHLRQTIPMSYQKATKSNYKSSTKIKSSALAEAAANYLKDMQNGNDDLEQILIHRSLEKESSIASKHHGQACIPAPPFSPSTIVMNRSG